MLQRSVTLTRRLLWTLPNESISRNGLPTPAGEETVLCASRLSMVPNIIPEGSRGSIGFESASFEEFRTWQHSLGTIE